MIGLGAYLNPIEGTLRQVRRALDKSSAGNQPIGVNFYSLANPDAALPANPLSVPPGQDTPARGAAGLAAALTVSNSPYEAHPLPVFAQPAAIPILSWKASPDKGHMMGFATRANGAPLDTVVITIMSLDGSITRTTSTDGSGFFGSVDLPPGEYMATVQLDSNTIPAAKFQVVAGSVATVDLMVL